ncbi:hypothetical protein [Bdellovibrio bacteriovorus]|uniref:hypothetical protein n=1 Tax=Bdellovibrio bacteriovorus TaxID=959 RepID=UPI0011D202F7|nr:hypothetical protein [Bdellovibrio bacteriovorus]
MKAFLKHLNLNMIATVLFIPLFSHADLKLLNNTSDIAQYMVRKGDQIIARVPGIAPGAAMRIPTSSTYEVVASAVIDGNTYTSAPMSVSGPTGFLAQVVQVQAQGVYEFNVVEMPSSKPNTLSFQKTGLNPVTFTISKDGSPLQSVVLNNSFEEQELAIDETYYIYAVINGVTTDTVVTTNPNATITAIEDHSDLEMGYYALEVSSSLRQAPRYNGTWRPCGPSGCRP